jgi:hypothetical protein
MPPEESGLPPKGGISKVKLAIGAASLFLFIVGVKRSYRSQEADGQTIADLEDRPRRHR